MSNFLIGLIVGFLLFILASKGVDEKMVKYGITQINGKVYSVKEISIP